MTGPAVFAGLAQVKPGKVIEARRADGRTAVYQVDRVKIFDKAGFPDKEVYGPSRRPELRVITCGGLFTRRTGYTSNVVVFAHLVRTREPQARAPQSPGPRSPGSRSPGSQSLGPQSPGPQSPVSRTPEPQSRGLRTPGPRTPGPQVAEPWSPGPPTPEPWPSRSVAAR